MELRPYQSQAIINLRKSLGGGKRRVILQAPTGAGKTAIAAAIVNGALAKGNRVCFVVPALSLIDQTLEMLWNVGIEDVGVIQGNHERNRPHASVQIASIQTLMRRSLPKFDVVIIDEIHRWFNFFEDWLAKPEWQKTPFIGLSATPWTKSLGKFWDELIVVARTQELIDAGYLCPFRVFAVAHPNLKGVRTVAGDYHEGELAERMDAGSLVADIVTTWLELGEDRPTFMFGVNRAHAKHIQEKFLAAGVSTEYIDAYTEVEDRLRIRDRFHAGETRVVCSVGCLTTGVDWDVRCIVLARPTKSEMLFVQMIGRGLRTAEGKSDCLILDHSDTTLKLGYVTDIHHDTLDSGKGRKASSKSRDEPLPKECPKCSFLKPPKMHRCPNCDFAPEKQSEVEHLDGELIEIKSRKATSEEKRAAFGMLVWYGKKHKYNEGWASHKFKEKFGVWPNAYRDAPQIQPTPALLAWVKSRQIAYAKRKVTV